METMLRSQAAECSPRPPGALRRPRRIAILAFLLFAWVGGAAAQSDLGYNPIFDYAANGDTGAVEYMLTTGTSVDLTNTAGETVLTIAAANGRVEILDLAIKAGARIDHEGQFGKTALCWAAERGHTTAVEHLLEHGADINHQTREGMTPLMLAVRADRASVVRLLLRHGADLTLQDYTGQNAAGWAKSGRDRRIDEMLRRAAAK
jgi:ankyrin repeat protein